MLIIENKIRMSLCLLGKQLIITETKIFKSLHDQNSFCSRSNGSRIIIRRLLAEHGIRAWVIREPDINWHQTI